MMEKEIYNTLYKYIDEEGNEREDLREVQLLDDFSNERIKKLIDLLHNSDKYISYHAMLILIAWGEDEGFKKLDEFINQKIDLKEEFEPHRIYGEDNVYDVISDALYISTYNTNDEDKIYPYIKTMLGMYGDKFFESRLKSILLKLKKTHILLPAIKKAIDLSLQKERYYQASQLLPIIAKHEKHKLKEYINMFKPYVQFDKRIEYNLEEIRNN